MIYSISKTMEISACHRLTLSYESKCSRMHGHNWLVTVYLGSKEKNQDGMVRDFTHIKEQVQGLLDHANLNEVLPFNPTAENIAEWIVNSFAECYRAVVCESEGNTAQAYDDHFPIDSRYLL